MESDPAARAVERLLYQRWDPLDLPPAFFPDLPPGDYDRYVLPIVAMVRSGAGTEAVVELLVRAERDDLGGTRSTERRLRDVAEALRMAVTEADGS